MALVRQHLIDPDVCIRCNTCEEICPVDAITHNSDNYVVDFEKCDFCGDCYPPCPTGAIDSHRMVSTPWTREAQFAWDELPKDKEIDDADAPALGSGEAVPDDVARIAAIASEGSGGTEVPPYSAAHPYINVYTPGNPAIATVTGNLRLTADDADVDIRHIVLDFGKSPFPVLEGQSIGILPEGTDGEGCPHHVRLYSVSSARNGERPGYNNVALTIKRISEDQDGNPTTGVGSNYMCDLDRGDEVRVTGPFGTTFLMPNEPEARIVMICTGTGSAPFRAMTERRRRQRRRTKEGIGSMHLFFGARRASELPYFGPLKKLPKDLIDVSMAFSREEEVPHQYVQDLIHENKNVVIDLLRDENSYIYICGHKRMEDGVNEAFESVAQAAGLEWPQLRDDLRQQGRLHVETYF
jgi:benzoyl-CoA 2,3-dioxygenase component A